MAARILDALAQLDHYRTIMHRSGAAADHSGIDLERRKQPRIEPSSPSEMAEERLQRLRRAKARSI